MTERFVIQPIKWLYSKLIKPFFRTAFAVLLPLLLIFFIFKAPSIHQEYIRSYVGENVYYVTVGEDGGGGTAFSILAPSGKAYLLTNDHICAGSKDGRVRITFEFGLPMWAKILERSNETDLCLIEWYGDLGLVLASSTYAGDRVQAVGHPGLRSLTLSNIGEIIDVGPADLTYPTDYKPAPYPLAAGECDIKNPKFHIIKNDEGKEVCTLSIPRAFYTTVFVKPGNSGSPLVNFYGNVVGVVSGVDQYGWGLAVPLKDIDDILSNR